MAKKKRAAWGSKRKAQVITLRYTINGAKFKLHYAPEAWAQARERIDVLVSFGVKVRVVGWPKRITQNVPPIDKST